MEARAHREEALQEGRQLGPLAHYLQLLEGWGGLFILPARPIPPCPPSGAALSREDGVGCHAGPGTALPRQGIWRGLLTRPDGSLSALTGRVKAAANCGRVGT